MIQSRRNAVVLAVSGIAVTVGIAIPAIAATQHHHARCPTTGWTFYLPLNDSANARTSAGDISKRLGCTIVVPHPLHT